MDLPAKMQEQQTGKLQKLSRANLPLKSEDGYTLSVYSGELSTLCIIDQVKKIKMAFPALPTGFYDLLTDRIRDLGFSNERLTDAVNNLIDTCVYPHPTIANIISWDRRIKLYTYLGITELVHHQGAGVWDNYKRVIIAGSDKYFASLLDIETYGLTVKVEDKTRFK
jgi:hypothetical protein